MATKPHTASCFHPVGWKRESKVRKLVDWDEDRELGKSEAVHANKKAKQGIHLPLSKGWQVLSHPQECRAPSDVMMMWEDKHHHFECVLIAPSFPSSVHWPWLQEVWDIPWVIWGQLSWLCPLLIPCTPILLTGGVRRRRKGLGCV